MRAVAILTAAGEGARLGHARPKALVPLAGVPLVARAAAALTSAGVVGRIVATAPPDALADVAAALAGVPDLEVVAGGGTRQASVAAALARLADEPGDTVVLVHDAARPLVPAEVVRRVADAVGPHRPAVVPAVPVADTVKQTDDGGRVVATLDRRALRAEVTPWAAQLAGSREWRRQREIAVVDLGCQLVHERDTQQREERDLLRSLARRFPGYADRIDRLLGGG